MTKSDRLAFDRYILDVGRGCLLRDGGEIALRPKTFAVLRYFIDNPGRLISKDEIFAAVWPDLTVTDDALVQSVGELRRGLGMDGPRLIRTIPRRGYRFESTVTLDDVNASSPPDEESDSHNTQEPPQHVPQGVVARSPRIWMGISLAGVICVVLLAAGAWWTGNGAGWTLPRHAERSMPGHAETGGRPVIAILPFRNQSGDAARQYFADGLTQDIINALGRFSELTVMSWNAVAPFGGKTTRPGDIARTLAVRYQVEGTVLQADDRVRVNAQLVDSDGRVLWSARFDEPAVDVFTLQDKITTQIAGVLAIQVVQVEQRLVFARPTGSLEAYDYVLRARPALQRPARANNVAARALLRQALRLDPNYAAAYAALAETYHIDASMGWAESPAEWLGRAEEMANKALSIDASEVRAHIILGRIHIFHQRFGRAMAEMDRAIAINPNDANGLAGRGNILMWLGETAAAIGALEAAQRIDPEMNAIDRFALSLAYYLKRRYAAAIEQAELNLRGTAAANFSRNILAAAYAQQNKPEDAARIVALIHRMDPTFDPRVFGTKFLNRADLEHLRDGFRKAGLYAAAAGPAPVASDR